MKGESMWQTKKIDVSFVFKTSQQTEHSMIHSNWKWSRIYINFMTEEPSTRKRLQQFNEEVDVIVPLKGLKIT